MTRSKMYHFVHSVRFFSCVLLLLLLLLCLSNSSLADIEVQILHTNDMHARFEQADINGNMCSDELAKAGQCFGGFARVKKAVDDYKEEARQKGIPSIFLNAGDTFQGTPYYSVFKWKIVAHLLSRLGIDVMSLGNHEFDDGIKDLASFLRNITIPVVAANLNFSPEPELEPLHIPKSVIMNIAGKEIGIIGYLLPGTKDMANTGNVIFEDEIEAIRAEAKRLKSRGINIIIALGHSGFDKDVEIAQQVPEVSLIVGGHSHSLLHSPKDKPPSKDLVVAEYPFVVQQYSGRKVPIVQAYCNSKYLGRLKVKFNDQGDAVEMSGNTILLDGSFKEDANVKSEVDNYKDSIRKLISITVGKTKVYLSRMVTMHQDSAESNYGNMATDALVNFITRNFNGKTGWTDASVALLQVGSIRSDIDSLKDGGTITYGDMLSSFPFEDHLVKVKINGTTLIKVLEHSVQSAKIVDSALYNDGTSRFLYTSGIKAVYDLSKPPGHRVKSLYIRCANCPAPKYYKLCPHHNGNTNYTIIVTTYLLNGGDGFSMIPQGVKSAESTDFTVANAVSEYIKIQQAVYPGYEGRITVLTGSAASVKFSVVLTALVMLLKAVG